MGDGSPEESTEPLIPWEVPPGILRPTQVSSLSNLGAMPPAFNRGSQGSGTLQGLGNVPPCPGTRCAPLHNERVEPEDRSGGASQPPTLGRSEACARRAGVRRGTPIQLSPGGRKTCGSSEPPSHPAPRGWHFS